MHARPLPFQLGPNASVDSGLGVSMGRQRSVLNSISATNGTYAAQQYSSVTRCPRCSSQCSLDSLCSSDPVPSPTPSHHTAPIYMNIGTRSKIPHDVFVYPVSTSTPAPSMDIHSNLSDWLTNGNDPRPDSATSSVLSRDSGVARSDPKSSRDFSAKSESSSKASLNNNSNHFMSTLGRSGLPSSSSSHTIQRLLHQQHSAANSTTDSNIEAIREKLQPLNTQRLKILRQATKSFIVSGRNPAKRTSSRTTRSR